jgi:hypothetical protein
VNLAIDEFRERFHVIPMRAGVLDLSSRADVGFVAARLKGMEPHP